MDTRTNQFRELPEGATLDQFMIPYSIGRQITFDDYVWEVEKVDTKANRMTLKPIGPAPESDLKRKLDRLGKKMSTSKMKPRR